MSTYAVAAAPRHSSMREHSCILCGHESLTRPVWLRSPEGNVVPAGTGCALKALYGESTPTTRRRLQVAQGAAMGAAAVAAEWQSIASVALAELDRGLDYSEAIQSMRRTFHGRGGAAVLGSFRGYVAHVAEAGSLER